MLTRTARVVAPMLAVLAIAGCTTAPTFEERLGQLESLKSRGTITDEEYAIMRRRLVESFDPTTLPARAGDTVLAEAAVARPADPPDPRSLMTTPPAFVASAPAVDVPDPRSLATAPSAEPAEATEPLSAAWVAGAWTGTHTGGPEWFWDISTTLHVSSGGERIDWIMIRRYRGTVGVSVAEAGGTATVREGTLELIGAYTNSTHLASEGTPVRYELRRAGQSLEGVVVDAHTATRALHLRRVPP